MAETRSLFKTSMIRCPKVWKLMQEILKQADGLMKNANWDEMQMKIYKEQKNKIDRAVDLQLREWSAAQYFNAGMFAGNVDKIYMSNALA